MAWDRLDVTPLYLPFHLIAFKFDQKEQTVLVEATNDNVCSRSLSRSNQRVADFSLCPPYLQQQQPRHCELYIPHSSGDDAYSSPSLRYPFSLPALTLSFFFFFFFPSSPEPTPNLPTAPPSTRTHLLTHAAGPTTSSERASTNPPTSTSILYTRNAEFSGKPRGCTEPLRWKRSRRTRNESNGIRGRISRGGRNWSRGPGFRSTRTFSISGM